MGISISLRRYHYQDKVTWDNFISKTDLGSVLHYRNYIEYHSDRFNDFSICFWKGETLEAVIPGTNHGDSWNSHSGLTFGGLISISNDPADLVNKTLLLDEYLLREGFTSSSITLASRSFFRDGNDALIFALSQAGYEILQNHLNQVLEYNGNLPHKKLTNARAAIRKGVKISNSPEKLAELYDIIKLNLESKYEKSPVHTLSELGFLCEVFPNDICIYTTTIEDEVVAGAIVFEANHSSHIQYLAANSLGKKIRAQDLLVTELFSRAKEMDKSLSFGKSTSGDDASLNKNLYRFKAEYGCRPENILTLAKIL